MVRQLLRAAALLCLCLGAAWPGLPASAAYRTVDTTATGIGVGEGEALADALANAVAQVNGTRSSIRVNTGQAVVEAHEEANVGGEKSSRSLSATARTTPNASMSASGSVASFEVVSRKQRPDGKYEVTVNARVRQHYALSYKAPGSGTGKTRIAVARARSSQASYDFFGPVSAYQIGDELDSATESALLRTSVFSVLDRQTLDIGLKELNLIDSDLTNEQEKAKLRNFRGADIILVPTVHDAEHQETQTTQQLTGQVSRQVTTSMDVEMRAIVPATSEVLFSRHYTISSAGSRDEALTRISSLAATDLSAKVSGKYTPVEAVPPSDAAPAVSPAAYQPPLPPKDDKGVKLPFDK